MGLFTKIFGGSRSKNRSWNNAYPMLSESLSGTIGKTGEVSNAIAAMLGLGGDNSAAFNNFKNSTGYNFLLDSGISAIKGGNASQGLFNSGATGQALTRYGQNLASTTYGDYMDRLLGLGQLGLGAANTVAGAGSESKGKSSGDTGAFGSFIGSLLSERSQKTNIIKLGELEDGLGIYAYEYKSDPGYMHIGTMADEVEKLRPWALGPRTEEGYRTVNYDRLNEGE